MRVQKYVDDRLVNPQWMTGIVADSQQLFHLTGVVHLIVVHQNAAHRHHPVDVGEYSWRIVTVLKHIYHDD
jgi:hypothetical protein